MLRPSTRVGMESGLIHIGVVHDDAIPNIRHHPAPRWEFIRWKSVLEKFCSIQLLFKYGGQLLDQRIGNVIPTVFYIHSKLPGLYIVSAHGKIALWSLGV